MPKTWFRKIEGMMMDNEVMVTCIADTCRELFEHQFNDGEAAASMGAECPDCGKITYIEVEKTYTVSCSSNVA